MKPIHKALIMFSFFTIMVVFIHHKALENKYLRLHEECMSEHDFDYMDTNCELCDSLIKNNNHEK